MTTILEKIKDSVEQGHYKVTEQLIDQALKKHMPAMRIVEESMVPAMRQMGEKYKNDQADIPKILKQHKTTAARNLFPFISSFPC